MPSSVGGIVRSSRNHPTNGKGGKIMLTFYYDDYQVRINDNGRVDYWRHDDITGRPVETNDPPAAVMAIAAAVLPLTATDVVKAEMRVARLREGLRGATIKADRAETVESVAWANRCEARGVQRNLSKQLRAAEGALQLARVEHARKAEKSC